MYLTITSVCIHTCSQHAKLQVVPGYSRGSSLSSARRIYGDLPLPLRSAGSTRPDCWIGLSLYALESSEVTRLRMTSLRQYCDYSRCFISCSNEISPCEPGVPSCVRLGRNRPVFLVRILCAKSKPYYHGGDMVATIAGTAATLS